MTKKSKLIDNVSELSESLLFCLGMRLKSSINRLDGSLNLIM